ncbi:MAG TPA: endonuclease V [Candidatus Eisenbacteria bacterium]|nr:endonuclease V [Candidatus Eisenbacteria bacterium]
MILAAVDVAYSDLTAHAACILFDAWDARWPYDAYSRWTPLPYPYVSGRFSDRELPAIKNVLGLLPAMPEIILIDGYVWLDDAWTPGLGGNLFFMLEKRCAVIGVAKSRYRGGTHAVPVLRGKSRRPLFITAAGMKPNDAAGHVARMHGESRIPTLLQVADSHARSGIEVFPRDATPTLPAC